ncbi:hypothetical protein AMECASPLE_027696 [Ameca splendens]|uniref:Uncharacterized protein n=1 Tax=Ameca splendens TaxID=208324 RepID=A0ABV1A2Y0_9TELE
MSGHLNGVAASFKRDNPAAVYVHCLNLCLEETGEKCKVMRDALDFVQEVAHIVKQSPKQSHKFQVLKHEMAPGNLPAHFLPNEMDSAHRCSEICP